MSWAGLSSPEDGQHQDPGVCRTVSLGHPVGYPLTRGLRQDLVSGPRKRTLLVDLVHPSLGKEVSGPRQNSFKGNVLFSFNSIWGGPSLSVHFCMCLHPGLQGPTGGFTRLNKACIFSAAGHQSVLLNNTAVPPHPQGTNFKTPSGRLKLHSTKSGNSYIFPMHTYI